MKFDFAANQEVDSIDKVPADFRGLYAEDGDKFKLQSDNPGVQSAVAAVVRLNEALNASRTEAKQLKGQRVDLTPLAEFGTDVEAIKAAIAEKISGYEGELAKGKDAKLNLDKIKEDLAKSYAKESEGKDTRIQALTNQLYDMMVTTAATTAVAEAKGDVELLMPFIKKQVKPIEEDGKFKVFVVDQDSERRYSGTTGSPMTITELVEEMKGQDKFGKLFSSETPRGPGFQPGKRVPMRQQGKELSSVDKISAGLRKGQHSRK